MQLIIKLIFIYLTLIINVNATSYYVTTTGSDSNDGSAVDNTHAFLTPTHGCSMLVAGDTLNIKGDGNQYTIDYNAPIDCSSNPGISGNPITIQAYNSNDPPLITWRTKLNSGSWASDGGNVWHISYGSSQEVQGAYKYDPTNGNVTILNKQFSLGALASEGDFFVTKGTPPSQRFYLYSATDPTVYTGEIRIIIGAGGVSSYGLAIPGYSIVSNIHTIFNWIGFSLNNNARNFVMNNLISDYGINRGFEIVTSSAPGSFLNDITCNNCIAKDGLPSYSGYIIAPDQEGFKFGQNNNEALASNWTCNNCQAFNNGYHGFQNTNGSSNVHINGGSCHDNDLNVSVNIDGACVRFGSAPLLTQSNYEVNNFECYNSRNCVTIYGNVNNVRIHDNYFHAYTQGGIYVDTAGAIGDNVPSCSLGTCYAYNNIFSNSAVPAFLLDDANNFQGFNNTINNSGDAIKALENAYYLTSGTFKNNIIIGATGHALINEDSAGLISADFNAFYSPDATPFIIGGVSYNFSNYKSTSSQDANSINTDFTTEFTNYAGGDYSITYANAPLLRDAGTDLSSVFTDDYTGRTRPQNSAYSIGAYEEEATPVSTSGITLRGVTLKGLTIQ